MTSRRRAALVLSGGFVIAGALVAPASMVAADPAPPVTPSVSIACIDRSVALLSVAESGLGLTSVTPLVPAPLTEPVPSTNPAVAVVTLINPTDAVPFDVLVARDADAPVPLAAPPGATVLTAFDVADSNGETAGTSVFRVTDPAGTELAVVASTSDCSPPPGWCDTERAPDAPIAADHADVCPVPGDEVFSVPEAADAAAPAPTGKVVEGDPEVMGAQLFQTPPPPAIAPPGAIMMPAPTPPPSPDPAPVEDEQAAAVITEPEPELARSGSQSTRLGSLAALLLGVGVTVGGVGRRRIDVELDDRAIDAMDRIRATARP